MTTHASVNEPVELEPPATAAPPPRSLAVVRIALGWVFLWAFLDKTFGLGFDTPADQGWIDGGSPTAEFFSGGAGGMYSGASGAAWADWLFMAAQAGLGFGLVLGVMMRIAACCGAALMAALWFSMLPIENNPVVDPHFVYATMLVAFVFTDAGARWGLTRRWRRLRLVQRYPVLG
ncbi:DoxX family membrane protein [Glycomyces albidus]|jgi:thiosulfate dehydrogenase [quinone] large subunit|uniref:DoxX family membrane protein n=1 Tax=Glycomyces albidus TaxID=2656774 RepID=A0A6L5G7F3_9ACTN|nr:DoxX family membrane protein [Glycomyces albidus]MQM25498.1 DoxX family membrane protein [Glycomyces albidus]